MIYVATCIATQHNLWLVALAAMICCCGAYAATRLIAQVLAAQGGIKIAWTFLTSLILGAASWTTHFVAMLAYLARAPVTYDPTDTLLSLLIAVCGTNIALTLATLNRKGIFPALGGGLLGLTIAAMHYVGILAFRVDGMVSWNADMVAVSVMLVVIMGAGALAAVRRQFGPWGERAAPGLLVLSILVLHFTGMAALKVTPLVASAPTLAQGAVALALATSLAAALVIAAGFFAFLIDARTRREAAARIATMAITDALTGLPNRAALEAELHGRPPMGGPHPSFGVLLIEIADFDGINQQHGLRIGSLLLQSVARRLVAACTSDVFLARSGGAQFCGIVPAARDGRERAHNLHAALSGEFLIEGRVIAIDTRFGLALAVGDVGEPDVLLLQAKAALMRAMADPMDAIVVHNGIVDEAAQRRIALAGDLRGALDRGEFELFFQPQVWISDRRVTGYEALLRWRHPVLGLVSPAEFIPLAEKTGSILAIGAWVLQSACKEAATWPEAWCVAVNLSPLQLRQHDLLKQVRDALIDSGLAPGRLEVELTESLLIDDRAHGLAVLRRIKALGVGLVLDDFGTGYSSMDLLRRFPFDKVKLDKSFLDDLASDRGAMAMLHAMLALGRNLSIPILVEGVENEWQLAILRHAGCNKVQGYLTGRPVPAAAIGQSTIQVAPVERGVPVDVSPSRTASR